MRIAEALDHPFSLLWACLGLAYLNSTRGELGQAARLLERALALCREWSITTYVPVTMASLGHVYTWSGRIEEGISLLQEALTAYESAGIGYSHSISVAQLGEAYLLAYRVEDACGCANRAVTLARARGEHGYEAWALRLLGDVTSHQSRLDVATAEAQYGAARGLASELGMRPHRPLPSWAREALRPNSGARAGRRAPGQGDRHVPRDGHGLLAGEGGGAGAGQWELTLNRVVSLH